MDPIFEELCAVDSLKNFHFFHNNLKEVIGNKRFRQDETYYVASILAHYSVTSRFENVSNGLIDDLSDIYHDFIMPAALARPGTFETRGSQVLLLNGFFRDQMCRRNNVEFYDKAGQSFFYRASLYSKNPKKSEFFDRMSESFPAWTIVCRDMSRNMRENRFLLRIN